MTTLTRHRLRQNSLVRIGTERFMSCRGSKEMATVGTLVLTVLRSLNLTAQVADPAEHVQRVSGNVTLTNRRVVSRDGRTATVTTTGTNAQGQKVHNTIIQTKQS